MDYDEDIDDQTKNLDCKNCGHVGLDESNGFYYCQMCGAQADDIILTDMAGEFVADDLGRSVLYSTRFSRQRKSHANCVRTQCGPASPAWFRHSQVNDPGEESYCDDPLGPAEPEDFGLNSVGALRYEDYYNEVRIRYIMGMQLMIQLQCEALVEKFNVSPLICGVAGTVWLRFVAATSIFKEEWADAVLISSEARTPGEPEEHKSSLKYPNEPRNAFGQRAVMIWFRDLRNKIPLSSSLAISFLACHVTRAAVLPTDIVKWSIGGNLPFFSAHVEIDRRLQRSSSPACPLSSSVMFRPYKIVTVHKLETMTASIADYVGLLLPPVNFYEIAYRFLNHLSLPVERILPHACCMYEWSMPPDLWFSTNDSRLPTRVYVMAILLVAIRILYNLNGLGVWERSLNPDFLSPSSSDHGVKFNSANSSEMMDEKETSSVKNESPSRVRNSEADSAELLHSLEATYSEICGSFEYAEDLPSYLSYCKDMICGRAGSTRREDDQEDAFIRKFWELYENEPEKSEPSAEFGAPNSTTSRRKRAGRKRSDVDILEKKKIREDGRNEGLTETSTEAAIRDMKLDMQDNRFCYMAPRCNPKRCDYLHYERRKEMGAYSYVAHADYYILLRACARVAQVDLRILHIGVLKFEKRLAWMESKIDGCLQFSPPTIP